jgi:K+-sensing histidine kinase KdpD
LTDVDPKLQHDIGPGADTEAASDPLASTAARYAAAVGMTAVATILAVAVEAKVTIPNLSLVFVVPVIIAGVSLGLGPSLCAAVLGALSFNFFLTEPRYSLAVDDPANIWAIGLLFVVGLIASGVAFTSHRRAAEAALLKRQVSMLERYTRELAGAENANAAISIASRALAALFQVPAVAMLVSGSAVVFREQSGGLEPQEADLEAARSALTTGAVARGGVYPNFSSRFDFWPLETSYGQKAAVGLAFDPDERPARPDDLISVIILILRLALERQQATTGLHAGRP